MMASMMIASIPLLVDYLWVRFQIDPDFKPYDNPHYWTYGMSCLFLSTIYYNLVFIFMFMSIIDSEKRLKMMEYMTEVIDERFMHKDEVSIQLPVFNMVDPRSIITWIELRKLVLHTGNRFNKRI